MLNPVKPVTHCWASGSCGGSSWIFREGGIPGFLVGQEQRGHPGGSVPPQVPLGAAWTFLSQCMENPLEPLVGRQSLFQRLPREDLVSFHVAPSPGSVLGQQLPLELWMAGPAQGVGSGVSPAPCPWFWGHSGDKVVLRSDSHLHTGFLSGCNGVIGLAGGILWEPGM